MEKNKIIIISFMITLLLMIPLIVYVFNDYKQVQEYNNNFSFEERTGIYYEIDDNETFYFYENNSFEKVKVNG